MAMATKSNASYNTYIPLPAISESGKNQENDAFLSLAPICIVTSASQLPEELLHPSPERQLVVGLDCEGVNLSRHGTLCIIQIAAPDAIYIVDAIQGGAELVNACKPALESAYITKVIHDCKRDSEALYFQFDIKLYNVVDTQIAYALAEEQEGKARSSNDYISFVGLLADHRYCGISYLEKKEIRDRLKQDPLFWTYRPFTEQMLHAAVDDFAAHYAVDVSVLMTMDMWIGHPYLLSQDILSVIDVPPGRMGCIIGKKGASIQSIKEACNAEIFIGGKRGPPDKVFIIGPERQVRKAEAMLRGRM